VLPTSQYIVWWLVEGRVPIEAQLVYRGITLLNTQCEFCNLDMETIKPIILGCMKSKSV